MVHLNRLMQEARLFGQQMAGHARRRWFIGTASLLLLIAFVLMLLHVLHTLGTVLGTFEPDDILASKMYRLDLERTYSEYFELSCLSVAAVAFTMTFVRTNCLPYLVFGLMSAYAAADGFFELHETMGSRMGNFGISGLGEMLVLAIVALVATVSIVAVLKRTPLAHWPSILGAAAIFGALFFFAAVVDWIHRIVHDVSWKGSIVLAFIEDGGELLTIVVMCLYSLLILYHWSLASAPAGNERDGSRNAPQRSARPGGSA